MEDMKDIIADMERDLGKSAAFVPFPLFSDYLERIKAAQRASWLTVDTDPNDPSITIASNLDPCGESDYLDVSVYCDGDLQLADDDGFYHYLDHPRARLLRDAIDAYLQGSFVSFVKGLA